MNKKELIKYYSSLDSLALKRLLNKPTVQHLDKSAIKIVLSKRGKTAREEQKRSESTGQGKKFNGGVFGVRGIFAKNLGRVLSGGRVNPK